VLYVAIALGVSNLLKRKILVIRESAIEDLAGMDVLLVDKTGTYFCYIYHLKPLFFIILS
jgi:magnesium-transporting ATPase (P-type)